MRIKNDKVKKVVEVISESLKNGYFDKEELLLYKIPEGDIETILEYQKRLPVLQQDNDNWIDAKDLWDQLGVKSEYSNWIKQQVKDMDLSKNIDFTTIRLQSQIGDSKGFKEISQYNIKVSTAKEIAMVAGAKGGRTSKELKENSRIARKYFIAIESAFKHRHEWNFGRKGSLIMCKELRQALILHNNELLEGLPEWIKSLNMYQNEFSMLNSVIIGMSATQYKKLKGLKPNASIRNYFTDNQLDYVERLERYDAQLINTQKIYDYERRKQILQAEFNEISRKTFKYV